MTGGELFALLLISCLLASIAHEATHYAVAVAVGRRPWFDVRAWEVCWPAPPDAPHSADYAVAVAPAVAGVVVGAGVLAAAGIVWWLVPGWYLYTLHGALTNDLQFNPQTDTDAV